MLVLAFWKGAKELFKTKRKYSSRLYLDCKLHFFFCLCSLEIYFPLHSFQLATLVVLKAVTDNVQVALAYPTQALLYIAVVHTIITLWRKSKAVLTCLSLFPSRNLMIAVTHLKEFFVRPSYTDAWFSCKTHWHLIPKHSSIGHGVYIGRQL